MSLWNPPPKGPRPKLDALRSILDKQTPEDIRRFREGLEREAEERAAVHAFGEGLAELGRGIALQVKIRDKPGAVITKLWRRVQELERAMHEVRYR